MTRGRRRSRAASDTHRNPRIPGPGRSRRQKLFLAGARQRAGEQRGEVAHRIQRHGRLVRDARAADREFDRFLRIREAKATAGPIRASGSASACAGSWDPEKGLPVHCAVASARAVAGLIPMHVRCWSSALPSAIAVALELVGRIHRPAAKLSARHRAIAVLSDQAPAGRLSGPPPDRSSSGATGPGG